MAVRFSKFKLQQANKFDLEGVDDLESNLAMLERETRKRIVVDGLFKGSVVTYHRVRSLVPKGDSRALHRSIRHKKNKASVTIQAGSNEAFYAPWVEYGTDPHGIKPKRRGGLTIGSGVYAKADHPGARAKPFMRTAMDETRDRVVDIATESIGNDIAALPFK